MKGTNRLNSSVMLFFIAVFVTGILVCTTDAGTFSFTGSMSTPRQSATATLISGCNCPADGKVLVAGGGIDLYSTTNTAELYDPATGTFAPTGSMNVARGFHSAALMPGGKVLIVGGGNPTDAEIYDPVEGEGTFSCAAGIDPETGYCNPTVAQNANLVSATSLLNGKVLITSLQTVASGGGYFTAAAIYDPSQNSFTCVNGLSSEPLICNPSMASGHLKGTATLLADGKVLIAGGDDVGVVGPVKLAEIYDPNDGPDGGFTTTGSLIMGRANHTATLLNNGQVLIAGGSGDSGTLHSAEIYNPDTSSFTAVGDMSHERFIHTSTLLNDGTVLVAGGCCLAPNLPMPYAEIYDPTDEDFTPTDDMNSARYNHIATLLTNGLVLVAGGFQDSTAELYTANENCTLTCTASVPPTGTVDSLISFSATATPSNCTGSPTFEWDFGDSSPHSTEQNPSHAYPAEGSYQWIVTANINGTASCAETGTIEINEAPPLPDLSILSVEPVQVVFNSDANGDGQVDLVKGKPTSVRVTIHVDGPALINPDTPISVRLNFEGFAFTQSFVTSELDIDTAVLNFEPMLPNQPSTNQVISAEVDALDVVLENNENNNFFDKFVTVKEAIPFSLYSFRLLPRETGAYETADPGIALATANNSALFLEATYPISELVHNYRGDLKEGSSRLCSPGLFFPPCPEHPLALCKDDKGFIRDMLNVFLAARLIDPHATRAMAIVSSDYFCYHGVVPVLGKAVPDCGLNVPTRGVLIAEGGWFTLAHEIGHTMCLAHDSNPASGRWVERGIDVNFDCFMKASGSTNNFDRWIDKNDYEGLFRLLRSSQNDPEVLLVSGIIESDGSISLNRWYQMIGPADEPPAGDFMIETLGTEGDLIGELTFTPSFKIEDDEDPSGIRTIETAGFVFSIPYPLNAATIQIKQGEAILATINPTTKLLHDAVDSVPDFGFDQNHQQRRNALHNKIVAVENMLEEGDFEDAKDKLEFDIKDKFEKWLVDYQAETPLQLSKAQLIDLVNEMINRVALMSND